MGILTARELDVLRLMSQTLTDDEIAEKLFVSMNTLRTHKQNIYKKLKLNKECKGIKRLKAISYYLEATKSPSNKYEWVKGLPQDKMVSFLMEVMCSRCRYKLTSSCNSDACTKYMEYWLNKEY